MRALLSSLVVNSLAAEQRDISIINTDNVMNNGQVIKEIINDLITAAPSGVDLTDYNWVMTGEYKLESSAPSDIPVLLNFVESHVTFHVTMVDRIVSHRKTDNPQNQIPSCEPIPPKAICVADPGGRLPKYFTSLPEEYGIKVRTEEQLQGDISLKLRVCNGTHSPLAAILALNNYPTTAMLSSDSKDAGTIMSMLDSYFASSILPSAVTTVPGVTSESVAETYSSWRQRLQHPGFGLSSFFICQNSAQKVGVRIAPTVNGLSSPTVDSCLVTALMLTYLTPTGPCLGSNVYPGVARANVEGEGEGEEYAPGLSFKAEGGGYTFRCECKVEVGGEGINLPDALGGEGEKEDVIRAFLKGQGVEETKLEAFAGGVGYFYQRFKAGDGIMDVVEEVIGKKGVFVNGGKTDAGVIMGSSSSDNFYYLHYAPTPLPDHSLVLSTTELTSVTSNSDMLTYVKSEVSSAQIIDLHTHLLPSTHGTLHLRGIDDLLTYHYLVAEYFLSAPSSITPEVLYAMTKQEQAMLIWNALFVERNPISEATRGVCTVLQRIGLGDALRRKDLNEIRKFYNERRSKPEVFEEEIFEKAGIRYAIMTNIPFDANEASYWKPERKPYSKRYRSALRVDPLLAGDTKTLERALSLNGYDNTIEGAKQYLRDWVEVMKPEYMMASTPKEFKVGIGGPGWAGRGVDEEDMKVIGGFAEAAKVGAEEDCCDDGGGALPTVIDEESDLLSEVLIKVCEEKNLPIALKIGCVRGMNSRLKSAGDGVVAFADTECLTRLCQRFPKVKFLATFLSLNNQHEAIVITSKFPNLHLYGCWWFVNNPSMIRNITTMRMEMLGCNFTFQHSDCRVLDQLLYKWAHSRGVLCKVLVEEVKKMVETGCRYTLGDLRKDVKKLTGGSYEDFLGL